MKRSVLFIVKANSTNTPFQLKLDRMADQLRQDILNGTYPDQSFLPPEPELAKRFQLSNKSVRKGMMKLVEDGLIVKIPRVGNRVNMKRAGVTLTLACSSTIERDFQLTRLLDDFHRQHPWIRVHTVPFAEIPKFDDDGDRRQADVIALDSTQFQQLKEEGRHTMLEPLYGSDDAYPFLNAAFGADDRQYVIPAIFSPIVLCYNRAHFRECRLPEPHGGWTWDELVRSATKLSENRNRFGICFHIVSENRWPLFLLQSGGRFEWEGGRLSDLRGTKLLEGIRRSKRLISNHDIFPHYLSENNDDVNAMFKEGKLSMIVTSYMGLNDFRNAELDYDISPLPYVQEPRTLVVVIGFGMNRYSPHKEAAGQLIDYFGSKRTQDLMRKFTLSIPALQHDGDFVKPIMPMPSRYGLYREIVSSYCMHSELNLPWRLNPILASQLKAYWADLLDEDELCRKLADKLILREAEMAER
ncbi:extracellular solute-binding protein [Paenibacillus mesophilus]|uniref:extracellular solute-binding protein n=1 Tax=Paenibacillus mesophilus TaxID=2582849 RepID=UPI00110EBF2A|nr:extracellular solute-binding protein [Paenibacillus mesophilus]TMV45554.1 extracellular solute-binding protein [Paenibacillus mesophilus]